jgi:hypothetical protein
MKLALMMHFAYIKRVSGEYQYGGEPQVHDQKHTCLLRKNAPTKTKKNPAAVYCRVPRLLFEAKG